MRFCDLFILYKLTLKNNKRVIRFTKLPLCRKIFLCVFFGGLIFSGILYIFIKNLYSFIPVIVSITSLIIFLVIDSSNKNTMIMLQDCYIPYSEKRMNMVIEILKKYNININDLDSIDRLIDEAKLAQIQCDYLSPLKKTLKILMGIIIPIVVFLVDKIDIKISQNELIDIVARLIILIVLIFSFIFCLIPIVNALLYYDYNKYDELIYDLRQIKLFYSKTKQ